MSLRKRHKSLSITVGIVPHASSKSIVEDQIGKVAPPRSCGFRIAVHDGIRPVYSRESTWARTWREELLDECQLGWQYGGMLLTNFHRMINTAHGKQRQVRMGLDDIDDSPVALEDIM